MKQKHRITALLTAICMLLMLVPFNAVTVTAVDGNFGGGSGTSDDPYLIEDAADLRAFRDLVNGGDTDACGRLVNDINLNPGFTFKADGSYDGEGTPEQWTPIGSENLPYIGTFSGDNKTISGVYINVNAAYQGLFGYIDGGAVQDLTTQDGYIQGNGDVGGISGYAANAAIKNCVNGCYLASTSSYLGGIAGRIEPNA